MTIAIRQLQKHFVGEVSGLDLRKSLTPDEAREVEARNLADKMLLKLTDGDRHDVLSRCRERLVPLCWPKRLLSHPWLSTLGAHGCP